MVRREILRLGAGVLPHETKGLTLGAEKKSTFFVARLICVQYAYLCNENTDTGRDQRGEVPRRTHRALQEAQCGRGGTLPPHYR